MLRSKEWHAQGKLGTEVRVPPHVDLRDNDKSLPSAGDLGTPPLAVHSRTSWGELLTRDRSGSWAGANPTTFAAPVCLWCWPGSESWKQWPDRQGGSAWPKVHLSPCSGPWGQLGWDQTPAEGSGVFVCPSKGLRTCRIPSFPGWAWASCLKAGWIQLAS